MLNKELLKKMIDEKLVFVNKHPNAEIYIHNYSPKVQYEKLWNEITLQTRGLILDNNMNVVARPFQNFLIYQNINLVKYRMNHLKYLRKWMVLLVFLLL